MLILGLALLITPSDQGGADDRWNPFAERDAAAGRRPSTKAVAPVDPRPYLPPMRDGANVRAAASADRSDPGAASPGSPGAGANASDQPTSGRTTQGAALRGTDAVQRSDLAPVMASDGSGLPAELWSGITQAEFEQQLAKLDIPPRSPALHALWRRLIRAEATPHGAAADQFRALQGEALYRSGLLHDVTSRIASADGDRSASPILTLVRARAALGLGEMESACAGVRAIAQRKSELPKPLRGELFFIIGYCAVVGGAPAQAGLAADLAREEGIDAPLPLALLDALAAGDKPKLSAPKRVSIIDYRLLEQVAPLEPAMIVERAEPALLAALVLDPKTEPALRLAAAEAGARLNAIAPADLADIYRAQTFEPALLADALTARPDPLRRRALLFKAAEAERTPQKKARLIRALLDDARRSGIYLQALALVAPLGEAVPRVQEISWFAETGVEIGLATGRLDLARQWVRLVAANQPGPSAGEQGPLGHWLALVDIADPAPSGPRGASLASVEHLALGGRFSPDMLHRLATVLDSLDYNVPIPLWDAANRTPQPAAGHLPETGVLSELVAAARQKAFGRTVLLAMRTLGPNGAEGAHLIALGDAIRALKRANLEADARRIALEALFAGWPRSQAP